MRLDTLEKIKKYVRAVNYLSVVQIYLKDNFLLEKKLSPDHIKPRLLGHWGTCPGINFVYANLNYFVKSTGEKIMFVVGPGHGFAAIQANLFIEGTLEKYYSDAKHNYSGIEFVAKNFSWPYGFPSHSNPMAPGVILEGGELGYSLSTAFGSILDNPDLITVCMIGDGEAETGPLAASWHLNKYIDPEKNGAVLPILHLNGYKISGPTVFGRMSTLELRSFFYGCGYEPFIVEEIPGEDIYGKMVEVLSKAYSKIKDIQNKSRSGYKIVAPMWPVIILKTPKGWTGIKELHGQKIEGNFLSHQVIAQNAKVDNTELNDLEHWLKSYRFDELFHKDQGFDSEIYKILPKSELKIGQNEKAFPKSTFNELKLPKASQFSENTDSPGMMGSSSMRRTGEFLNEVVKLNHAERNFRIFSPDETYSNKLDKIFESTSRSFTWPTLSWDKDISHDGRVIEILSEHSLLGLLQGYVLTGRHGIFASYEAFVQIVSSMTDQFMKFLKVCKEIPWRKGYPSLNIILTSSGWRQDHNGFSHQNPGFISDMLERDDDLVKVYFPPDGNTTLAVLETMLASRDQVNVLVAGKTLEPRWLDQEKASKQVEDGIMVWDFASEEDPDFVICGIGDYMTKECLAAIDLIKIEASTVKIRFVNIVDPMVLKTIDFEKYFTKDKPVIFNFHGYPGTLKKILYGISDPSRFEIRGYVENGSTTTPYDMQIRNETSRWHILIHVLKTLTEEKVLDKSLTDRIIEIYKLKFEEHQKYIIENGVDLPEIQNWQWGKISL